MKERILYTLPPTYPCLSLPSLFWATLLSSSATRPTSWSLPVHASWQSIGSRVRLLPFKSQFCHSLAFGNLILRLFVYSSVRGDQLILFISQELLKSKVYNTSISRARTFVYFVKGVSVAGMSMHFQWSVWVFGEIISMGPWFKDDSLKRHLNYERFKHSG